MKPPQQRAAKNPGQVTAGRSSTLRKSAVTPKKSSAPFPATVSGRSNPKESESRSKFVVRTAISRPLSKDDKAAIDIFNRIDRELAVEHDRADRLLQMYGLL
jgi:hypothetical protein